MQTFHFIVNFIKNSSIEHLLIVIFVVALLFEYIISVISQQKLFEFKDSVNNVLIGALSLGCDMLFSIMLYKILLWFQSNVKLFEVKIHGINYFIFLFILIDFIEYWFHRCSHTINLFWQAHVVHHQSRFFNMTVGLRTSFFVPILNVWFYLPLVMLGFNPDDILKIVLLQGGYQLLIHTELVGNLGFIEYILITPSAHRVHHGSNEMYLDKNFGKVFMIWDILYGTFLAEGEQVKYGVKEDTSSRNSPLASITDPMMSLFGNLKKYKGLKRKLKFIFGKPSPNTLT